MLDTRNLKKIKLSLFIFHIAQIYLYLLAVNLMLAAVVFILGGIIDWWLLPISFSVAVVCLLIFYDEKVTINTVWEIVGALIVLIVMTYLSGQLYDMSYDGNTYHKVAIGLLENGWNPLKELPTDERISDTLGIAITSPQIWIEAYCKGPWIFAASIYSFTGNIECGKVYNLLGMWCVFVYSYYYLSKNKKGAIISTVFSILATSNPVVLQQMDTFYVDGFLYSMLYVLVIALIVNSEFFQITSRNISASLITCAMLVCGNIKFTGLLYGGIFCIAYYLWYCLDVVKERSENLVYKIIRRGIIWGCLAIVTIFVAGSSTYLTNYIRHGTLTYPLTGKNPIDIMSANAPFLEENHIKNLLYSLFSKVSNLLVSYDVSPELKIPFSVYWTEESVVLNNADIRLSGFGIWFSGILIIAIVFIVIGIIKFKMSRRGQLLLLNVFVCCGLCFAIKESWWARYSPYLYFLVLIGVYICLKHDYGRISKQFKWIMCSLFLINNFVFLIPLLGDIRYSSEIRASMNDLKKYECVYVDGDIFGGTYLNLKDVGVSYIVDENLSDLDSESLGYMSLRWRALKEE